MAGFIAKKIFKESLDNKFGQDDPYFETVPATRLGGKPKKRRKANPPGLSKHDGKVLTKVKRRAYRLDMSLFNCCGIRFGWSSVIGLVPAIGDILDLMMALMVFRTCNQVEGGLPPSVKAKMIFNISLDFAVGLVPILGDLADAVFRANTRNAAILEQYLREKGKKSLRASGMPVPTIDPSDPDEFDRMSAGDSVEYTSSQPSSSEGMVIPKPKRVQGRNELRDMEEGVMSSHQRASSSREQAPTKPARSKATGKSSWWGR